MDPVTGKGKKPAYTCQVCGFESTEEVSSLSNIQVYRDWFVHRVQFVGGYIDVVTCKECDKLSIDQIFEGCKKRIREGFIEGYH